ncbi:hypothetical protein BH09BAC1_BH09BAC1_14250 [soil metagenome]
MIRKINGRLMVELSEASSGEDVHHYLTSIMHLVATQDESHTNPDARYFAMQLAKQLLPSEYQFIQLADGLPDEQLKK